MSPPPLLPSLPSWLEPPSLEPPPLSLIFSKVGDIIFTTGDTSVKANNIQRDNRVSICIDDQIPPFSFVTIFGTAKIYPYKQKEVFKWAKKIAERYMGKGNAEAYGRRNSEEGLVLVRIKPTRILAEKDISAWE